MDNGTVFYRILCLFIEFPKKYNIANIFISIFAKYRFPCYVGSGWWVGDATQTMYAREGLRCTCATDISSHYATDIFQQLNSRKNSLSYLPSQPHGCAESTSTRGGLLLQTAALRHIFHNCCLALHSWQMDRWKCRRAGQIFPALPDNADQATPPDRS